MKRFAIAHSHSPNWCSGRWRHETNKRRHQAKGLTSRRRDGVGMFRHPSSGVVCYGERTRAHPPRRTVHSAKYHAPTPEPKQKSDPGSDSQIEPSTCGSECVSPWRARVTPPRVRTGRFCAKRTFILPSADCGSVFWAYIPILPIANTHRKHHRSDVSVWHADSGTCKHPLLTPTIFT
jgi:hypothetical protein